jgi:hypothetical protein
MKRKAIMSGVLAVCVTPLATVATAQTPGTASVTNSGFNPAISLILAGRYLKRSNPAEEPGITGFILPGGDEHGHAHGGLGDNGFSLGDTELAISGNIDPNFYGSATVALTSEHKAEVEEAYVQTTSLGHGMTLKAGRFLSGIGYANEQHVHAWDFVDQPLAYQAILGGHVRQDGAQLRWIAPTERFIELGAELAGRRNNGNGPALFANIGGDIGDSQSWRAGLSHIRSSASDREFHTDLEVGGEEMEIHNAYSGDSRTSGVNLVWKWAPDGNSAATSLKLQGEYFRRAENGEIEFDEEGNAGGPSAGDYRSRQSGWYLQGVYQFMPQWRAGLRHDRLHTSGMDFGANNASLEGLRSGYNPSRNTVMLDYAPSEFARVRVQFARDKSRQGEPDNQFSVQYVMSLGAHGAHKF